MSQPPDDQLLWLQQTEKLIYQQAWEQIDRDRLGGYLQSLAQAELAQYRHLVKKMMAYRLLMDYGAKLEVNYYGQIARLWEQLSSCLNHQGDRLIALESIYQELYPTLTVKLGNLPQTCPYSWDNLGQWDEF